MAADAAKDDVVLKVRISRKLRDALSQHAALERRSMNTVTVMAIEEIVAGTSGKPAQKPQQPAT